MAGRRRLPWEVFRFFFVFFSGFAVGRENEVLNEDRRGVMGHFFDQHIHSYQSPVNEHSSTGAIQPSWRRAGFATDSSRSPSCLATYSSIQPSVHLSSRTTKRLIPPLHSIPITITTFSSSSSSLSHRSKDRISD